MNLKAIKEILENNSPDIVKENQIIYVLAEDKEIIPNIMDLLEAERATSKALLQDANLELSRALVGLVDERPNYRLFIMDNIKNFYLKWQNRIKCCFKIDGLP